MNTGGELFLTKTRLALLVAVEAGHVLDDPRNGHTYWAEPPDAPFRVDARVREAERAGWIELDETVAINWQLTETGRAILTHARKGAAQ